MNRLSMPTISSFYGIKITIYFNEGSHKVPHIHGIYSGKDASFELENGDLLEGSLGKKQDALVKAWILIHQDELIEIWRTKVQKQIEPLH